MQRFNVLKVSSKLNGGFTLLELIIITIMVGILSAIAAPSFLGLFNRSKVNNSVVELRGALQEAQAEAIKRNRKCEVTLNTSARTITSSCLLTGTRTLSTGISLAPSPSTVSFSFKGTTTSSATISVYLSDSPTSSNNKCLTISSGIGIMKVGQYNGDAAGLSGTCTIS